MFLIFLLSFSAVSCFPGHEGTMLGLKNQDHSPYTMPAACVGQSYCLEKGDDYPDEEDIMEVLLENHQPILKYEEQVERQQTSGSPLESECSGTHEYAPVYYVLDERNRTRAVVQSEDYEQLYDLRWCNNEGHQDSTRNIFKNLADALKVNLSCVNSYMTYDFSVLSLGNELKMEIVKAKVPVCCRCLYEKRYD